MSTLRGNGRSRCLQWHMNRLTSVGTTTLVVRSHQGVGDSHQRPGATFGWPCFAHFLANCSSHITGLFYLLSLSDLQPPPRDQPAMDIHPLTHASTEGPLGFPVTDRQAFALDAILKALPQEDAFRYRK